MIKQSKAPLTTNVPPNSNVYRVLYDQTVEKLRWMTLSVGALKQTLTFACTPSDVRHW